MRLKLPRLCSALAVLALVATAYAEDSSTPVLRGKVFDVHDGDTIKVQLDSGPIKVRFHGVDAPELNQAHGGESRNALLRLVNNRVVDLEPIGQSSYDRLVAIVYVGDVNVNEAMVKSGEAWAARKYLRKRDDADWCAYENAARQMRRGLWSQRPEDWIDPREWYHRKKRHYVYKDHSAETTAKCIAAIGKS